jgi:hypothetical protein
MLKIGYGFSGSYQKSKINMTKQNSKRGVLRQYAHFDFCFLTFDLFTRRVPVIRLTAFGVRRPSSHCLSGQDFFAFLGRAHRQQGRNLPLALFFQ